MFDIVGGGQQFITGERLKTIGRIIGINEQILDDTAEANGICFTKLISFDDF